MKFKCFFSIPFCVFAAGIYVPASVQVSDYWKDKTSKQGDITIIKNLKEPFFKNDLFLLKEEIAIGGKSAPPEETFSLIGDICAGPDGRIYIADMKTSEIKIFDKSGKFIRTFGRKGQGPGEFLLLSKLSFCFSTNELFVQDRSRGLFFDPNGNFLRSIPLRISDWAIKIDATGNLRGLGQVRENNGEKEELRFYDEKGKPEKLLAQTPIHDNLNPFQPFIAWCMRRDGTIVEGYSETYEFRIHNLDGTVARQIFKDSDPIEVTSEWRDAFLKNRLLSTKPYRLPRYQPAYSWMFSDEKGWIFIGTLKKASIPNRTIFDIFDQDGHYLNEVSWPMGACMIENGKLYSIEIDEDGYAVVRRFAMISKKDMN
jgi:hypothetical protein